MISYLDTDMLSLAERKNATVLLRISEHELSEAAITIITFPEQINGRSQVIRKAKVSHDLAEAYRQLTETVLYLQELPVVGFNHAAILRFENLLKMKLNVGKNDLRIAAIVLEADGIVVTRNRRDFGRIPGLRIEDWSQEEIQ